MQIKNKELHRITSTAIVCKDKKYLIKNNYEKIISHKIKFN
jgi:hypothetical protein